MNKIENAFRRAYKKRTFLWLMLILPPVFLVSMKIAGYFFSEIKSLLLSLIILILIILAKNILVGKPKTIKKIILKAFHKVEVYDEFSTTIDFELHNTDAKFKTISNDKISICITATWFVLVTPNGSLICKRCDIIKITSIFRETNSRYYLKITLSDRQSFLFPYPELEELLIEWIQIKRGE